MNIKQLVEKYKLTQDDVWKCQKSWVVSHNAVEKIMAIENINIEDIKVLNSEMFFARFLITATKDNKKVMTIGEAIFKDGSTLQKKYRNGNPYMLGNCDIDYIGSMAEKRGIDRAVLKLINAYEYGIYSESEADNFKKPNKKQKPLTYEDLAKHYPGKAMIQPMENVVKWAKTQTDLFYYNEKTDEIYYKQ